MPEAEKPASTPQSLADVLEAEWTALDGRNPPPATGGRPEAERLKALFRWSHEKQHRRSALCLSGGGIRSASFGLGVVQRLAKSGVLGQLDYLSTVSGGGYLGAWLSAWMQREGRATVLARLADPPRESPLVPEWPTVSFLRAYSNYLTPRLGILSADTWALVATFLRNMLLNWLVLIPPLLAALMIPRFFLAALFSEPPAGWENAAWILAMFFHAVSVAYAAIDMPTAGNARWSETRFVAGRLVPLVAASYFTVLAWAWRANALPDLLARSLGLVRPGWSETLLFALAPGFVGALVGGLIARGRNAAAGKSSRTLRTGAGRLAAMLVPGLMGAWILREGVAGWFPRPTHASSAIHFAAFGVPVLLAVYLLLNFLVAGLSGRVTKDGDREWWGRSSGWLLLATLALALQGAIVFWGPYMIEAAAKAIDKPGALGTLSGLLTTVTGLVGGISAFFGFSGSSTKEAGPQSRTFRLAAGAAAFVLLFDLLLSYATHLLAGNYASFVFFLGGHWYSDQWSDYLPWLYAPGLLLAGLIMSWLIDVNRFSLHTMYRNRLIRTFLGASHTGRVPHPFTGFDESDNLQMRELSAERPLHVVNMALNLTSPGNLAWQERKAESFTATRLQAGARALGYQPVESYGRGLTLGTAITVSGAAANPNMGYHSSPLVTLLMTLFNVRLGWWLPNPGPAGHGLWQKRSPTFAAGALYSEALGRTRETYPWVNLSDGGHFENLGLYEMVLRRCHTLIVVDGGQDGSYVFEDLGNAIRKIRIDFGIPIQIDIENLVADPADTSHPRNLLCCALGTVQYGAMDPGAPDGRLLYIKPVVTRPEPTDIRNYRSAHQTFPHESTADQFFSESQLESYRMLGWHSADLICGEEAMEFVSLDAFLARAEAYSTPPPPNVTKGEFA